MRNVWSLLERMLLESKQYRGDTGVTFKALTELILGKPGRGPGILGRPPKPEGEAFDCSYSFDPSVWGKWFPSLSTAMQMAVTDKDRQHVGTPQGGTVMKRNYGGRVVYSPGKPNNEFERLPSAMDRYDVLMQAEVTARTVPDPKTKKMKTTGSGVLMRMAYSPSIGDANARTARLQALMSGQDPGPTTRRPQPVRPEPTKQDIAKWDRQHPPAQPVIRTGQNVRTAKAPKDDGDNED